MIKPFVLVIAALLLLFPAVCQVHTTENLILVTLDGYRWREVFQGVDEKLLQARGYVTDTTVFNFRGDGQQSSREKLMPFFWSVIAERGQLYGNRSLGNRMNCANFHVFSYPGYNEMLTGFVDPKIKSNDAVVNPNRNVLEVVHKDPAFGGKVAAFTTWEIFPYILREELSGIYVNSGKDKAEGDELTEHERYLNKITDHERNHHGNRFDKHTFEYAMEYLKRAQPRLLFISLDETDDMGHQGKYDEYLKAAHDADHRIGKLWEWIQSNEQYRNKTTLIVTTDHGRGTSRKGFKKHSPLLRGSGHVWMAVLGPDTPAEGEMDARMRLTQSQVAATISRLLEVPFRRLDSRIAEAVPSVFGNTEAQVRR